MFVCRSRSNSAQHLYLANVTVQLLGHIARGWGSEMGWSVLAILNITADVFGNSTAECLCHCIPMCIDVKKMFWQLHFSLACRNDMQAYIFEVSAHKLWKIQDKDDNTGGQGLDLIMKTIFMFFSYITVASQLTN